MPRPGFTCIWGMMTVWSLCHFGGCSTSSKSQGSGPRQQNLIWWQQCTPLKSHWRRTYEAQVSYSEDEKPSLTSLWHIVQKMTEIFQQNFDGFCVGRQVLPCITLENGTAPFGSFAALQTELIDLQEHVVLKERRRSHNVVLKCTYVHVTVRVRVST